MQCAWLLQSSGQLLEVEPFLPTTEEAIAEGDAESLILIARCVQAQYNRDGTPELLERTWSTLQSVTSLPDVEDEQQQTALRMTMDLLPKLREEVYQRLARSPIHRTARRRQWRSSKSPAPHRRPASNSTLKTRQPRLANLRLQKLMIESLLESDPDRAAEWGDTLALLAFAWLHEAEVSRVMDRSTFSGPRMQRDMYGNLFYVNDGDMAMQMQMAQAQEVVRAIRTADVLSVAPNPDWLAFVSDTIRPKFAQVTAQLHLKVSDEERGPIPSLNNWRHPIRTSPATSSTSSSAPGPVTTIPTPVHATPTRICSCTATSGGPAVSP